MADTPQIGQASEAIVTGDLPCFRCGYNLRTMPWDGRCPERNSGVRESAPPAGFRFTSRGEARRVRLGLLLLVASIASTACMTVAFTVALLHLHQLPRTLIWVSYLVWQVEKVTSPALELAAMWLILRPPPGMPNRPWGWLRWAAIALAFSNLCAHLIGRPAWWMYAMQSRLTDAQFFGAMAAESTLALGRPLAVLLLCCVLLRLPIRHGMKTLRFFGGCSVAASALLLLEAATDMEIIVPYGNLGVPLWSLWGQALGSLGGLFHSYDMGQREIERVGALLWVVILLFLWALVRRLKTTASQKSLSGGTS